MHICCGFIHSLTFNYPCSLHTNPSNRLSEVIALTPFNLISIRLCSSSSNSLYSCFVHNTTQLASSLLQFVRQATYLSITQTYISLGNVLTTYSSLSLCDFENPPCTPCALSHFATVPSSFVFDFMFQTEMPRSTSLLFTVECKEGFIKLRVND